GHSGDLPRGVRPEHGPAARCAAPDAYAGGRCRSSRRASMLPLTGASVAGVVLIDAVGGARSWGAGRRPDEPGDPHRRGGTDDAGPAPPFGSPLVFPSVEGACR